MAGPNTPYFYRSGGGGTGGASQVGVFSDNALVNGAFDYWQAGTSATITATGGGTPTAAYLYQADQWYVKNTLGGGTVEGVITYSQVTGVTAGSLFGAKIQITTAPTGTGIQNGCELYQALSNKASQAYYGNTASLNVLVKSLGNVTQVGIQLFYATSEAKLTTAIGSEQLTTVNSSTFTTCNIAGQALGTSQTAAGIIGVRIRPTAVSSGNLYDLNNGFVVEQAMLNLGISSGTFSRQYNDPAQELMACQYFYEVFNTAGIGTAGGGSCLLATGFTDVGNTSSVFTIPYKVTKRVVPSISVSSVAHFQIINSAQTLAGSTFTAVTQGTDVFNLKFTTSGTLTGGSACGLYANNTAARIIADARL